MRHLALAFDAPGLIVTFVWALDDDSDRRFVERRMKTFNDRGGRVVFAELEATQEERLRRNATPLRVSTKLPQQDVEGSRRFLIEADAIPAEYARHFLSCGSSRERQHESRSRIGVEADCRSFPVAA